MKKFFTMMALVAIVLGVSAQTKTLTAADPTILYGLTTAGDYGTDNGSNSFTKEGVTYEKSGVSNTDPVTGEEEPNRWRFTKTDSYVGCILANPLKVGDVIEITAQASSTSSGLSLAIRADASTSADAIDIACGSKAEKTYSYTITQGDMLVGKSKFYVMINNSKVNNYKIRTRSVRVLNYVVTPDVLTENCIWDFSAYATCGTTGGFVCDNLFFATGVSVISKDGVRNEGDDSSVSLTKNMLNLPGNSGKSGDNSFDVANGKYLMLMVPAGSGSIKVTTLPNGSSKKSLFCKVGDAEAQEYSQNGTVVVKSNTFMYDVTEPTPVYLYVGGNSGTYYIASIEVTPGTTNGIGVTRVTPSTVDNNYYNLSGMKIHPQRGKIYIFQGKKVIY